MMGLKEYFKGSKEKARETFKEKDKEKKRDKNIYDAVKSFERDRADIMKKSLRQTRLMLGGAVLMCALLAVAIMSMMPLKTVEPFLIRVDSTTGYTDKLTPFAADTFKYNETVSRYFLTRFVENREGYEWYTVQSMHDTVELMAGSSVFKEYKNMMTGQFSPLTKLKKNNKIMVRVKSVTFLEEDLAQVRFVKAITDNDGKPATGYVPTEWIGTVKFEYEPDRAATEAQRQINPFGLTVVSYRADPEAGK